MSHHTNKLTIKVPARNSKPIVRVPQTLFYPSGQHYWPSCTSLYYGCVGGGQGVPLDMLSWDIERITPLITGGADLIFKGQPLLKRIELRVMVSRHSSFYVYFSVPTLIRYSQWTGYVDPKEDEKYYIMVDEATTRAKLGHVVAILVFKFMKVSTDVLW